MQEDNRTIKHGRTSFKMLHEREEAHNQFQALMFFRTKPIPVVQAVETGTDGHLSGSSGQPLPASTNQKQMTLRFNSVNFVVDRWKTEIMWALKCVVCDWSINSAEKISDLFKVMFSDSLITSEYRMSHTRLSYLINFGIAPHFRQFLVD